MADRDDLATDEGPESRARAPDAAPPARPAEGRRPEPIVARPGGVASGVRMAGDGGYA